MNNKGYTLIEVIVSIMILSIASITLAGAFVNVIHFMSKSNDVKNASNSMYALAEGDSEVTDANTELLKEITYEMSGIKVEGSVLKYSSSYSDDIHLVKVSSKKVSLLKDNDKYIKLMDQLMHNQFNLLKEIDFFQKKYIYSGVDINTYTYELFRLVGDIDFYSKILPMNMFDYRLQKLYIRVAFPWQKGTDHGAALIFVSDSEDFEIKNRTDVYLVFLNGQLYCYNTANVSKYYLDSTNDNILRFYKDGNLLDYDKFENEVLTGQDYSEKSLWKKIVPNAVFDGYNSTNIWQSIDSQK